MVVAEPEVSAEVSVVSINPAIAASMLEHNNKNRPRKQTTVNAYARQMAEGLWALNGESIKLSVSGELLDGQHRLLAVIQSGATIQTYVARGLPDEAFHTLDTGIRRSAADTLALKGEAQVTTLAAACAWLWRYQNGIHMRGGPPYPSTIEVEQTLAEHPSIRESINKTKDSRNLMAHSLATVLHYLFAQKDEELADIFFETIGSGINLHADDPIRILRERLIQNRVAKAKLPNIEIMALVIKAWMHVRLGTKIKFLRWRRTGDAIEAFPDIV